MTLAATGFRPDADADYAALLHWLRARRRVLVCAHPRPDGDAFGSIFGAWRLLSELGIPATPYVAEAVPTRFAALAPCELVVGGSLDMSSFDAVLCLDAARVDRVDVPGGGLPTRFGLPVANVDHHIDNPGYGDYNLVDPGCAATCEMLARLCMTQSLTVSAETATAMLVGVLTDTGGLRFANTSPSTLASVAWLIEQGAAYHDMVRQLFMTERWEYMQLKAYVVPRIKFAANRRYAWFALRADDLTRFGVTNSETDDLIELARGIAGVDICCRLHDVREGVRISLRSATPALPIIKIAHAFGGGGHTVAAGATIVGKTLEEAEDLVLKRVEEMLSGS